MTKSEIFKYPIMMITIVVGLVLVKLLLDIDVSRITKIGPQGIELDHETRKHTSIPSPKKVFKIGHLCVYV